MKVSDYVMEFLADHGVEHIFFLPGGGCMHLVDSLGRSQRVQGISCLHEQAAAIAAEEYSFVSEKAGACLVTTGPGGTNAVTAVQSAYSDSMPVFFVSGQVKTSDLKDQFGVRCLGSQEAGIVDIVSSITKYAVMVRKKEDIRYHLEKAWDEMNTGRKGPVWVDIPLDIQGAQIEPDCLEAYTNQHTDDEFVCSESIVVEAAHLIAQAERPVVMTGNGLLYCKNIFYELVDFLQIPIIPSWKLPDLICNDHPLYAGKCGTLGDRAGNYTMQNADLILSLGCRLDFSITGWDRMAWAPHAKKIVVDIDSHEIDKLTSTVKIDIAACCDVKDFIKKLLTYKDMINEEIISRGIESQNKYSSWKSRIQRWQEKYPLMTPDKYDDTEGLSMYAVVEEVSKQLASDAVIVAADAGNVVEISFQSFSLKQGQKFRGSHALGSMGYELPNAIGAFYATGHDIVCFAGDGGMQLNIQELATIAGRNLPIKIIVMENNGYGSIQNMQRNHFEGYYVASEPDSGLYIPDMMAVGKAYGFETDEVRYLSELKDKLTVLFSKKGPAMLICHVNPRSLVEPRSASRVMPDGSIKSSALENQYPFLSDSEVAENMLSL